MKEQWTYTNHLIHEKSPYLLQHSHNPVQWYPWKEEAFQRAQDENKLIFLSIGYSTCHWCHVMEKESFEDQEVALVLNENYIAMKVDREERPDIDAVYMTACQAMTGQGGWPLTILMTPEQKPLFAGTYLPKTKRYGAPGLIDLLEAFARGWKSDRTLLEAESERIVKEIYHNNAKTGSGELDKGLIKSAAHIYARLYDHMYGGFGEAPKFPTPHNLLFLMHYGKLEGDTHASQMVWHTLTAMYRGGMYDHVGGGFSRYSTDRKWLIPHFEKMLYDNVLLAYTYLEAYQMSGETLFGQVAKSTLFYVAGELTNGEGGFYCGQDADSDGVEGKYYVYTVDELKSVLGNDQGTLFCRWFGASEEGNFEGKNVLNLIDNDHFYELPDEIANMCRELRSYREHRTSLHKDDKILTAWNGLMIAGFAKAYQVLGIQEYLETAKRAEQFVEHYLADGEGRLTVRYRKGERKGTGQLDDYAFMAWADIELYQATFDTVYLEKAITMLKCILKLFWDETEGGFYMYASDAEQLIHRPKEVYDGALPSGNSIAAWVLAKVSHITGEKMWSEYAHRQLEFLSMHMKEYPAGYSAGLLAMMEELYGHRELVCVVDDKEGGGEVKSMLRKVGFTNLTVVIKTRENAAKLEELCNYTKGYPFEEGRTTYYLCENGACMPKMYDIAQLLL